jgi:hypothetical protein
MTTTTFGRTVLWILATSSCNWPLASCMADERQCGDWAAGGIAPAPDGDTVTQGAECDLAFRLPAEPTEGSLTWLPSAVQAWDERVPECRVRLVLEGGVPVLLEPEILGELREDGTRDRLLGATDLVRWPDGTCRVGRIRIRVGAERAFSHELGHALSCAMGDDAHDPEPGRLMSAKLSEPLPWRPDQWAVDLVRSSRGLDAEPETVSASIR